MPENNFFINKILNTIQSFYRMKVVTLNIFMNSQSWSENLIQNILIDKSNQITNSTI